MSNGMFRLSLNMQLHKSKQIVYAVKLGQQPDGEQCLRRDLKPEKGGRHRVLGRLAAATRRAFERCQATNSRLPWR